jgi:hypothetical protein
VVSFLDPRGDVATPMEDYALAADWSSGPPSIGLLANSFPDCDAFMAEVGEVLAERLPSVALRTWRKPNVAPASDQVLDGIEAEVSAVIAAYGH